MALEGQINCYKQTVAPKVSVIVAAYNAEKYLARCLDSIAAQTMPDWECIVVDDGSTDRTGEIADSYAASDARFHIIHQENGGVAAARQVGLDASQGEYTIHADSDDWVEPSMLQKLVSAAQNSRADIVICDFYIHYNNGFVEYRCQRPRSLNHLSVLGEMMFDLHGSLCNKLVRSSSIKTNGITFINAMNIAEDQFFILQLLAHPVNVSYVNSAFYHYDHTQNDFSLCNSGVLASSRLRPLDMIAEYTDISSIQAYYDKAVFHIAFEYLYEPRALCPDYPSVFKKYKKNIRRVKGFRFRDKLLILLRIHGISLPLSKIKECWKKIKGNA